MPSAGDAPMMEPVGALTVHVNRPELVDDLVSSFLSSGCPARRMGPRSCAVEHESAVDEREARVEITFFLRAWQARHDRAQASLVP
jgi:hypothetical protein